MKATDVTGSVKHVNVARTAFAVNTVSGFFGNKRTELPPWLVEGTELTFDITNTATNKYNGGYSTYFTVENLQENKDA